MTENIDQVAATEDDFAADAITAEENAADENADVAQEPDTALEEAGNPDDGGASPGEIDGAPDDIAIETGVKEAGADDDEPAAS